MPRILNKRLFSKMKRVSQRTVAHCGPAVLEMLLSFHDIKVHQDAFINAAHVGGKLKKHGMSVPDLGKAIKHSVPQAQLWYKRNANLSDVERLLDVYNHPVGVEWQGLFGAFADGEDDGHYSVIIKVDRESEKVHIADPFWARDRKISTARFKKRWWDVNLVTNPQTKKNRHIKDKRMIFVVTPKKELFPKKMGMRKG